MVMIWLHVCKTRCKTIILQVLFVLIASADWQYLIWHSTSMPLHSLGNMSPFTKSDIYLSTLYLFRKSFNFQSRFKSRDTKPAIEPFWENPRKLNRIALGYPRGIPNNITKRLAHLC